MKRRIWFVLGIVIAILVAWQTLSKPRSIVKQFYMAGVRVQHVKSIKTPEGSNYIYSTPIRNRETVVDVLGRADYHLEPSNATEPNTVVYVHQDGSFLKPETRRISLALKGDTIEIVANFPI